MHAHPEIQKINLDEWNYHKPISRQASALSSNGDIDEGNSLFLTLTAVFLRLTLKVGVF